MSSKKVLVGMSGGVDSSLAAALLVEAGYDVTGVFLKVWSEEEFLDPRITNYELRITGPNPVRRTSYVEVACPWQEDLKDAQAVAEQLGIELVIRNVQREYWDRVVSTFLDGYRKGLTPNPDILCNSEIKFGILYDWALAAGFEYVATGHYARLEEAESAVSSQQSAELLDSATPRSKKNRSPLTAHRLLHRGSDEKKDQTYFLWNIDRSKLAHILFPIGHLTKVQVREEAAKRGLATAAKKDSQGICFLGKVNVREWLKDELKTESGEVVDTAGNVIGRHDGAQLYTAGQRAGLRFQIPDSRYQIPVHYVVERDLKKNRLVVDVAPPTSRELVATQLNWLADEIPNVGDHLEARIRHGQTPQAAEVKLIQWTERIKTPDTPTQFTQSLNLSIHLRFAEPQTAIAPGQSVVLSQESRIVGGGIIQ